MDWLKRCALISLTFLSSHVFAFHFDKLVVFGDSLSDSGNLYKYTNSLHHVIHKVPVIPSAPYYEGMFSNGPVWDEDLAGLMGLDIHNKKQFRNIAFGGSWIEPYKDSKQLFPYDLSEEVGIYLNTSFLDLHKADHLYLVWDGGNDYLNGRDDVDASTTNAVNTLKDQIARLIRHGAEYVLVPNLPDLGITPRAKQLGPSYVTNLTDLSRSHNEKLAVAIKQLQQEFPNAHIISFDVWSHFKNITNDPQKYGLKNATTPCFAGGYTNAVNPVDPQLAADLNLAKIDLNNNASLQVAANNSALLAIMGNNLNTLVCQDPNDYLYWDEVHPTAAAHKIIAQKIFDALKEDGLS